jgi:ferric-dicitrate binding protein FerR (iron transport regulator)
MIQTFHPAHEGVVSYRTPDPRRRARRTRLVALLVIAAVGFSAGLLQQFHDQASVNADHGGMHLSAPTGPFAYFPR